ncbi:MAG TPA: polysaccharide deacetylase family protein [Caulobacteraceae bacterium]|jgi:peptidoglycan/xylan/chitin deacetylase (PgdA/CDA1 family)
MSRLGAALSRRLARAVKTRGLRVRAHRPIVSFTFDDVPRSAFSIGGPILEAAGACGTYYVAGKLVGTTSESWPHLDLDDLRRLSERGHELGCHTFSHARAPLLSARAFRQETEANQEFLVRACGDIRLTNFAWPFGEVSPARKLQAQATYATCRGITPGVNFGVADLGLLRAVALYDETRDDRAVEALFERAQATNGWLIFYTHDVQDRPTQYGASIDQLRHAVRLALDRGFEILTIRNAVGRLAFTR